MDVHQFHHISSTDEFPNHKPRGLPWLSPRPYLASCKVVKRTAAAPLSCQDMANLCRLDPLGTMGRVRGKGNVVKTWGKYPLVN